MFVLFDENLIIRDSSWFLLSLEVAAEGATELADRVGGAGSWSAKMSGSWVVSHIADHLNLIVSDSSYESEGDQSEISVLKNLHGLSEQFPELQLEIGSNEKILRALVHFLNFGSAEAKLWSCAVLVNLAYRSEVNKINIGSVDGIITGLLEALKTRSDSHLIAVDRCQQEACGALSNIAFSNSSNSLAIAKTPGMLQTLLHIIEAGGFGHDSQEASTQDIEIDDDESGDCVSLDTREEAALVLSNCAANSREAAELIVACPGSIECLKSLFKNSKPDVLRTAVGVFGNLSKCEKAACAMRETNVIEEVLRPALEWPVGCPDVNSSVTDMSVYSMKATALMALTRLSVFEELRELQAQKSVLSTIVIILGRALNNRTWASINWQLPSPLTVLALLTINKRTAEVLASDALLLELLVSLLQAWIKQKKTSCYSSQSHALVTELDLALTIVTCIRLSSQVEACHYFVKNSVPRMLRTIARRKPQLDDEGVKYLDTHLWALEDYSLAVSMALHVRLGSNHDCYLGRLDERTVFSILQYTFKDISFKSNAFAEFLSTLGVPKQKKKSIKKARVDSEALHYTQWNERPRTRSQTLSRQPWTRHHGRNLGPAH
ncbi:hypothetical protein GUITHDRAFT_139848 [Guillardia theta CCMP2712]|uniref:Vacuolar protein 8 n=1 Tax=Guillardia theta (strain CCMP2712) TaxID=905079 RepID=L1J6Z5_GUITC|nr:hypothetical protein GUITHDRAFT_139848 [Guillardia theta CCMP2712]EKX44303.1 hypothetical protein GUITHDRAFT_139848 [Guillardia theta CCMP2712]|eukprot:XP_005831283.1 hypothetical protein GUITHDRAFT_139848 [Guillardia theta CCMP2712]